MNASHLKIIGLFLYIMLGCSRLFAAVSPFSAIVDKNGIEPGGVITLTLEMVGGTSETPDLDELSKNFDILSQSKSSESQYLNGRQFAKTAWSLEISPKFDDQSVTIPAIKLGPYRSNPIPISQGGKKSNTKSDRNIEFSASVDTPSAFIKEQIILTIELKTSLPLQNGSIEKPAIGDGIMESLGEDELGDVIENGIKYHKLKRRYALFFTTPTKIVIKPITFEGTLRHGGGGMQGLLGFYSTGQRVRTKTNPIEITIKDIPISYPKDRDFLPLKSLIITESLDNNETFKVSKATARKFELRALGTLASFLPAIDVPRIDGVQVYAEPGEKVQKNTIDGLETSSSFSHVFIPLSPQKIHAPKQEIYWWDTVNNQVKTVSIRALDADVTGIAPVTAPAVKNEPVQLPTAVHATPHPNSWWPIIALGLFVLWLVTVWYFIARRKKIPQDNKYPENKYDMLIKNIINSIDQNSPKEVLSHLQALKIYCSSDHEKSIILNEVFFKNLDMLESALYQQKKSETKDEILKTIKTQILSIKKTKKNNCDLKTLYPN